VDLALSAAKHGWHFIQPEAIFVANQILETVISRSKERLDIRQYELLCHAAFFVAQKTDSVCSIQCVLLLFSIVPD
jgi:hypothetical protein